MSLPPTDAQIEDAIMDLIKNRKVQPDTIFPVMQVHLPLQEAGLTAEGINRGLKRLAEKGWLKAGDVHWTLTAEGHKQFGPPPSEADVERRVLDEINAFNPRPNTIFPIMTVNVNMQRDGFSSQQIYDALDRMRNKGWLKPGTVHWTITAEGHKEL